ncbi:MAG: glycosyltransferase family 87 protein, partial [Nesterenkonia sp.]
FDEALATFEYPALTMVLASLMAMVTHGLYDVLGGTGLAYWEDGASLLFWDVTFLFAAGAWLVLVLATMKAAGHRPWDAAVVAVSPALIFGVGINWDIWPAAALALAVLFFLRGKWWLAGVLIGVGLSFKLYPLFMLGAVLTLAVRRWIRQEEEGVTWATLARVSAGAAGTWLVVNVPLMLVSFESWSRFFVYSSERGAGYSSVWHVWDELAEAGPSAEAVSLWSFLLFALACAAVLVLGVSAPQPPRMVQLLLLIVAAFLLVNKVYSPQFMIWLVPLMVLAAPRLRDIIIWHGFQILHFWAVWMYLAGVVGDYQQQHSFDPALYVAAVIGHLAATGYIAAQVIADICHPERDVVRADVVRGPARR